MSKDFTEVAFNHVQFQKELVQFRELLNSKKILAEREIQRLFKASLHLTAYIGTTFGNIGVARHVAYEFQIMGDYELIVVRRIAFHPLGVTKISEPSAEIRRVETTK